MMLKSTAVFLSLGVITLSAAPVAAHCQIPCGIYDDKLQMQRLEQHVTTIDRSIMMLDKLSGESPKDYNQISRWIDNKENHAQGIQDIVTAYFMAQRIKPPASTEGEPWDKYIKRLTLLHEIQIAAMKAKQSADRTNLDELRSLLEQFRRAYFRNDSKGR